jgi:NADH:ubiquinone oxidoreductase subunit 5 (subunit L)/multisubunit Na+/H+ antiporter MnhA subunit
LTNSYKSSLAHVHDAPFLMGFPLILLAFGSLFVGYFGKDMMIGLGTSFWGNALYTLPQNTLLLESEYIPQAIKSIPLFLVFLELFLLIKSIFLHKDYVELMDGKPLFLEEIFIHFSINVGYLIKFITIFL